MTRILATTLLAAACSNAVPNSERALLNSAGAEAERSSLAGIWASDDSLCRRTEIRAELRSNGTYVEAGGHGRWRMEGDSIHIRVIAAPRVTFRSMYPELIALDEDGILPIAGPGEFVAVANDLSKTFTRCP